AVARGVREDRDAAARRPPPLVSRAEPEVLERRASRSTAIAHTRSKSFSPVFTQTCLPTYDAVTLVEQLRSDGRGEEDVIREVTQHLLEEARCFWTSARSASSVSMTC